VARLRPRFHRFFEPAISAFAAVWKVGEYWPAMFWKP
jgi:hypothetical protein